MWGGLPLPPHAVVMNLGSLVLQMHICSCYTRKHSSKMRTARPVGLCPRVVDVFGAGVCPERDWVYPGMGMSGDAFTLTAIRK